MKDMVVATANIWIWGFTGLSYGAFWHLIWALLFTQQNTFSDESFPSAVSYFKDAGYSARAIHPYNTRCIKRKQSSRS